MKFQARHNTPFAQKVLGIGMLVVFLLASLPHQFIHDVIANHKDTVDHYHVHEQVSSHHIHCKFLQVVLAPYLAGHQTGLLSVRYSHYHFPMQAIPFIDTKTLFYSNLRGPPRLPELFYEREA